MHVNAMGAPDPGGLRGVLLAAGLPAAGVWVFYRVRPQALASLSTLIGCPTG